MNRDEALIEIVEDAFPLFNREVQIFFERIRLERGGPTPAKPNLMDLLERYYDHFASYLYYGTKGDKAKRKDVELTSNGNEITAAYRVLIRNYVEGVYGLRRELLRLNSTDFHERYRVVFERRAIHLKAKISEFDEAQFYAFPDATANFDFWLDLDAWLPEEAIALSLNKNPDKVSLASINQAIGNQPSNFLSLYKKRLKSLERAIQSKVIGGALTPAMFINWAAKKFSDLPHQMTDLMQIEQTKTATEGLSKQEIDALKRRIASYEECADDLNPKVRRTLYLMMLVMACKAFGHRLSGNTNSTSMIVRAFEDYDISISPKTVKSALQAAAADESLATDVAKLKRFAQRS